MEAETHTMGAGGFVPSWDVDVFGAPTPPQPLVKDSVVNIVGAAFIVGIVRSPAAAASATAGLCSPAASRTLLESSSNGVPVFSFASQLDFVVWILFSYA